MSRIIIAAIKFLCLILVVSILWVVIYRWVRPPLTWTMAADIIDGHGARRDWIPIVRIDRDIVRAAIAAEDSKFCAHDGFDIEAIEDALQRNASGGRIRGGSTISQQTAKNVFLWQGGGYLRKGMEAWFTVLIEQLWGKRRIMEMYLNVAETGIGTYGVNAGALRYYAHDASAMSAGEAARIAAILPLPKQRGAIAPKGFTRRFGNTIAARIPVVARDGLDACVYRGEPVPANHAAPARRRVSIPGEEYERSRPPKSTTPRRPKAAPTMSADPVIQPDEPSLRTPDPAPDLPPLPSEDPAANTG